MSAPDAVTGSLTGDFGAGLSVAGISLWRVRGGAIASACIITTLTLHLCEAGLSTCGRLGFGSVARQTGKVADAAEKLGKLCGEKCLGGGNNVEIVPFGCFATTRIERIVVAHPQRRKERMGHCVRLCRAIGRGERRRGPGT